MDVEETAVLRHLLGEEVNGMNCWEFMKCGCEQGGLHEKDFGVCPAWPEHGNRCAEIAGTLCGSKVEGVFALKMNDCTKCKFFNSVHYDRTRLVEFMGFGERLRKG